MHYFEVAPNKIIRLDKDTFTYSSAEHIEVGQIVLVEVGHKKIIGVVTKLVNKPSYPTKEIISKLEGHVLPQAVVDLSKWMSEYYNTPLALVLQAVLPSGIQKKRQIKDKAEPKALRKRTNFLFNTEQSLAIKNVDESIPGTFLLQGITGSGKTEVYIELAKRTISSGKSVIILIPEISLTTQILSEFNNYFKDILVVHSAMTEAWRHSTWLEALQSCTPRIVIGARSAIFTPLKDIGLIVVDEAHEPSYKQEQAPRYSALRVATMLGRYTGAKVVFGSATPSVIDRYLSEQSKRPILMLTKLARTDAIPAEASLVDMTEKKNFSGQRFLSKQLVDELSLTLEKGLQSLIFHNRRGSAAITLCENCGWTALCPNCYVPLTLHSDHHKLNCHICGYKDKVPTSCPICSHVNIIHKGIGTKLIESELAKLFPQANIARFDADNESGQTLDKRYKELYDGKIDIAIGTQIVAKGLDLPHLRTVGVIQADSGLSLPDFSSSERTFQLLAQVIGRVGRTQHASKVIVQTYQPTHPSIVYGLKQDYESFYKYVIAQRQKAHFPPFTYLLKLSCSYKSESSAIKATKDLASKLRENTDKSVEILGPTPAFYERKGEYYRWQLILKSPKREYLIKSLNFVPKAHWQSELDPTSLL